MPRRPDISQFHHSPRAGGDDPELPVFCCTGLPTSHCLIIPADKFLVPFHWKKCLIKQTGGLEVPSITPRLSRGDLFALKAIETTTGRLQKVPKFSAMGGGD